MGRQIILFKLCLISIPICIVFGFASILKDSSDRNYQPSTTQWFESEIQLNFKDGTSQIYNIDVYESYDNIELRNGNFSYWKCTKETGGVVSKNVQLASYVKSYKVLKSEFKIIKD